MEKISVFIDNRFLMKLNKSLNKGKPIILNLEKFCSKIANNSGFILDKIYFYCAPPFQSGTPSEDERKRKIKYDKFISKLKINPRFIVKEGKVIKVGDQYMQKQVDILLSNDLFLISLKNKSKNIILLACDSDFVPTINQIKENNVEVIIFSHFDKKRGSKFSTSNEFVNSASKYFQLTKKDFEDAKK